MDAMGLSQHFFGGQGTPLKRHYGRRDDHAPEGTSMEEEIMPENQPRRVVSKRIVSCEIVTIISCVNQSKQD